MIAANQPRAPVAPDYWPVDAALLALMRSCKFDIFLRLTNGTFVLYRQHDTPLDPENLKRLRDSGVTALFIRLEERAAYEEALRTEILPDSRLPAVERQRVVKAVMRREFETAHRSNNISAIVSCARQLGRQLAETLKNRDFGLLDLFDNMGHDCSAFARATNTSVYCVVLADHLGIVTETDRPGIATGGLLRDIGMRNLPGQLLNKTGALTREERRTIGSHAQQGFEELNAGSDRHWGQLMMAYQHHERLDASGYPVGLVGDEIHPWAKICAVADVFDALTGSRPYRTAFSADAALTHLQSRAGTLFDKEVVACLATLMRRS